MMWDTLTLVGQTDLAVSDVREASLTDSLTKNFAVSLKQAAKRPDATKKKRVQDKLLAHDLNKLKTEELKNSKVCEGKFIYCP